MSKSAVSFLSEAVVDLTEEPRIRVLHVDDEADILKCTKKILENQGNFKVETASSVDEAMEELREKKFDVIVSDYLMPKMDGLQFLIELRKRGNKIPFILFTGKGREEVAINALNLGADYYANKIGDPRTVYGQLGHYINRAVEKRKAAIKLRKSEEKYRKQFEEAMDAIFLGDAETGKILDCNRAATKLVERKKSEIVGKHQRILHPSEEIEGEFSRTFKQHRDGNPNHALEDKIITKNGEIKDVLIKASVFKVGNKRIMQGTFRDITEQKRMEEQLRESKEKYRSVLKQAPDLIVTLDEKGIVTSCNADFESDTDYYQHEIIGKHFLDTPLLHGVNRAHAQKLFNAIINEKHSERIELAWLLKDGTPRISEIRIGLIKRNGKIAGFTAVARDITERKKAEEKLDTIMKELVTINEKLSAVSRLTRHDARNKLAVITNNAYLAKLGLGDNHSLEYLGEIESAVDQMEQLFDFARTYEMVGVEELSNQNVAKSVDEAALLFPELAGTKLVNECNGLTVLADSLLRQLFYNLIDNTLRHGKKTSQIRVHYEEVGKDKLKLVYEDNGVGILEDEKALIFNEGYGKNTGYGLYLIKKICTEYGWTIQETGKPGKGAQFTMTIPKTNENRKITYKIE